MMPFAFATSLLCGVILGGGPTARLLPPKPISPIEGIYYEDDPRALRIGFQWSQTGSEYRFQLSRDGDFRNILVNRRVSSDGLDLEGLGVGEYFWRVATLSERGQGPFSAVSCFFITTTERKDDDHALICAVLRSLQDRRKPKRAPSGEM